MYHTTRYFYPHGIEGEAMDCTFKKFDTFEKALRYAERYSEGLRFAGVRIEDDNGEVIYEITSDQETVDYRPGRREKE